MAYQTPSSKSETKASKSSHVSDITAEKILDIYRIYLDRGKPRIAVVEELVQQLKVPRDTDTTPNSKYVKAAKAVNKHWSENMEIHALADKLLYRPKWHEDDDEGEPLIYQERDQLWEDRVPRPADAKDSLLLQNAMEVLGAPARPKPDLFFGYDDEAFPGRVLDQVKGLPKDLFVYPAKPWFPYLMVQWKSAQGTVRKAEVQARRDTGAAIDTIYRFFKHSGTSNDSFEPSPAETCVFSLMVHAKHFEYRIHWRRVGDDGLVSYEGDIIAQAFFNQSDEIFKARSVILKTLEWVRGRRLTAIRNKLKDLAATPAPKLFSARHCRNRPAANQVAAYHPSKAGEPSAHAPILVGASD
ncbi:MAG: hypothetical protein Q9201_002968 [Fulgogasparrea decipioides]